VLSGFLIGGILLDAKLSPRYYKSFYLRRAFRILPLYGVLTGIFVLYHLEFSGDNIIPLASYITLTQNIWMAHFGVWGAASMGVTWSLAVEEQFYLTIPLLVRRLSRRRLTWALISIVVAAPIARSAILLSFRSHRLADYVLMPCRADALCLGVLCAVVVRNPRAWSLLIARRTWLRAVVMALLMALSWLSFGRYDVLSDPMVTLGYSLLALFYVCCLLLVLMNTGTLNRVLCNRRLMGLGRIAYCVYLLHVPFIVAGRVWGVSFFTALIKLPTAHATAVEATIGGMTGILLCCVIAKISWRFFEQPLLRRGHTYKY